ncbi:carcinoembryonic antigen-related cell adhesion molecule 5-like [Polyodon spathula]|uniref:carcinoembryonic antigen-related cell adhesion molecule 5-like n=1 Tax=Polyodon spathula TaxID=7913 RepID=UPI001B7E6685|nr:carcinoembryonic antigen-related cell adhesion molecule 5-like [Polyodon spathula]
MYISSLISFSCMTKGFHLLHSVMENTRVPVLTLLLFALIKGYWCLDVTIIKNPVKIGDDVLFEINPPSVPQSGSWNAQTMLVFWFGSNMISGVGYKGRVSVNTSTGSLTLKSVRLSDSGKYFVQVQTTDGFEFSGNTTLTVFEPVSQPTVRSNVTNPVEFNDTVSLTCTASGSAVSYQWLNGSSVLSDSERIHLSDDNKTLTIPRVLRSDDGTLHCYVFNAVSNSTSEPFHLIVSYGPDDMTINPPEPIYSSAGSDLTLSCYAQSSPPAHYQWFFNGAPLNKLGSQLNMAHIGLNQTGNYTCWASNNITLRYGDVTSSITVIEPITNVTLNPTPAQPILNNPFNLTCEVSGLGSADSRLWMMDGQPLSTDNRITLSVDNSTVFFNPVLLSDNGIYQCTASNLVSNKTGAGYKLIVNYGPEEAFIKAPDLAANGSAIKLTCSARSQPPSEYNWYLNGQQTANGSEYKIDHVNSDNQGIYICVAWNSVTGRNSSAIKELTVIDLITEVSVNHTPAHPILNDNLSLTCAVYGTVDSRHWLKDGQPLSTEDGITLSGDNSTVSFNPVLMTDNGTYQCTANNPLSNKTSDGYTLVVNYGPEQASITGPHLAAVGSSVTLTCSAHSQPHSEYTWYLNGTETAQGSHYNMSPVSSANSGPYTCVARNSVTGNSSSAVIEFIVIELITEVSVNHTPAHPILNDNLNLTCAVSGTVDSRHWLKDGQPLSTEDGITLSGDNSTVSFNPVLMTDNGTYQCTANNPLSNKTSNGYTLVVNYGPEQASITGPHLAAVGSSVTLTCSAHSQPPSEYTWYLNGTETAQGSHYNMSPVSAANSGPYTCVAQNSVTGNSSSAEIEFIVIEPASSINVEPTPAYPIENNTFSLTCNVTWAADSRLWWKDDQPLSTTERITLSGDNSTVSFHPVLQSDNGIYQCTASNPVSQLTSTGYRLVVNYGPQHVSITGPTLAFKGSTVTFTCSAHSQPSCEYTWYFKGKETAKGSQYKISAVSTNNNGRYTCVAWNSVTGRNSSAIKDLVVADLNGSASLASGHAVEVVIAVLVLLLCVSG